MAHYLSEATHAKTREVREREGRVEEYDYPLAPPPPSKDFEGFIRAMEVSAVGSDPRSKNSVKVWTADQEGSISVRNIQAEVQHVIPRKPEVHVSSLRAHGPYMWAGMSDGYLRVFDLETMHLVFEQKQHCGRITCIESVGPDVYTGSDDWQIFKWSTSETEVPEWQRQLSGHQCGVLCLAQDGGNVLFSGSEDFTIRCWDLERGQEKLGHGWPARNHSDAVTSLAICEVHLFSASRDGTIKVWNTQTGQQLKFLDRREGPITSLLKDPAAQRVWAGGADGVISVYDAFSLKLVTRMYDHEMTFVKYLGLVVRLSSLKVWSVNEDGIVKVWYADEDNTYDVYEPRSLELQETVEDKRAQLVFNYNEIEKNKEHYHKLVDIDTRRKAGLATELGRKARLAKEAGYYHRILQWMMKRRDEAKRREVADHVSAQAQLRLMRMAYTRLQHYTAEQREARRKLNVSTLLQQQTSRGLSTTYWRNLLEHVRRERALSVRAQTSLSLEKSATSKTLGAYYTTWYRWRERIRELKGRTAAALELGRAAERVRAKCFYSRLVFFAELQKSRAQARELAEKFLKSKERITLEYSFQMLLKNRQLAKDEQARQNRRALLHGATELKLLRQHWNILVANMRANSESVLRNERNAAQQKNKDMEELLSMQAEMTDEQIDAQLEELEKELQAVLDETEGKKKDMEDLQAKSLEVRKKLSRTIVVINRDATPQEQLAEVMLLLKGRSVNCGGDFEHLTEAREEGKKIGPTRMYDEGLKKVKKVVQTETKRRAQELGAELPKEMTTAEGEWLMVDSVDAFLKKSVRSAASAIKDMIIAYDMMTINPAALAKAAHNQETVANAGLLLDIVTRYFRLRNKDDGKRSSRKKSSKKKSKSKGKGSAKKTSAKKKKSLEGTEGEVVPKKTSKKSSKKKSSKKRSLVPKTSKKSSTKKSSKKKSSKKKSSKKKLTTKKSSTKKKSTKKKSTKKKSTKKKSLKKKSLKKKSTKKKSTKKKSLKKKSLKKKTGKKKSTKGKKKSVKKLRPATAALRATGARKLVDPAKKPWLGMMIQVEDTARVVVHNVMKNGPAARAGFGDNDVVVNFGGSVITDVPSFQAAFREHAKVGAVITVRALHDGQADQPFEAELQIGSAAEKAQLEQEWTTGAKTLEEAEARADREEERIAETQEGAQAEQ